MARKKQTLAQKKGKNKNAAEVTFYDRNGDPIFEVECKELVPDINWPARKFRKNFEKSAAVIIQPLPKRGNKPIISKDRVNRPKLTPELSEKWKKLGIRL